MNDLHYGSGEEVRPGDKVVCADDVKGKVVMIVTSPDNAQSNPLGNCYVARRTDDVEVFYQPSDN